jgi:hypothetical protein
MAWCRLATVVLLRQQQVLLILRVAAAGLRGRPLEEGIVVWTSNGDTFGGTSGSIGLVGELVGRLRLAAADMRQAARAAALLAELHGAGDAEDDSEGALVKGVVFAYARPFTRRDGVGALDPEEWAPVDSRQALLHRSLIASRARLLDQGDWSLAGSQVPLRLPGGVSAGTWMRVSELAAAQGRWLTASASRLEDDLQEKGSSAGNRR